MRWACLIAFLALPACTCQKMTIRWDAYQLFGEARDAFIEVQKNASQAGEGAAPLFAGLSEENICLLQQASEKVGKAIAVDPLVHSFHLLAIQIAVLLGDEEEIETTFEYALSLFPDDSRIRGGYASYLLNKDGQSDVAAGILDEGLVRSPENIALRMEMAEIFAFYRNDSESATEMIFRVLKVDELPTGIIDYLVLLSFRMEKEGHLDPATEILAKTMSRSPNALENTVPQAVGNGLGDPALSLIRRMLDQGEAPRLFHLYEVFLCVLLNRLQEAEAKLDTSVLVETSKQVKRPEFPQLMRCFILIGRGQASEGVEGLLALTEKYPLCLEAHAKLLEMSERYPGSVDKGKLLDRLNRSKGLAEDPALRQWLYHATNYLKKQLSEK